MPYIYNDECLYYNHYNGMCYDKVNKYIPNIISYPNYPFTSVYPDARFLPFSDNFEVASYCNFPNSVRLVETKTSRLEHIKLNNDDVSCSDVCNSTFGNVLDSKKIKVKNESNCVCKLGGSNKFKYVCM